jgi:hypothetical protein
VPFSKNWMQAKLLYCNGLVYTASFLTKEFNTREGQARLEEGEAVKNAY